jgi:hypothetical protein
MFDIAVIGARLAEVLAATLKNDSSKVKAVALAEAEGLAQALARIAGLLAQGQIDREEAAALIRIQKDASEAVLASLAEISRVAAHRAVELGLKDIAGLVLDSNGASLLGELL